jgi:AI-2 transport protein TqsA
VHDRVQTICLVVLATIAVGAALHWLGPVMVPFVLGVFIAQTVAPLVDLQVRHARLPRWLALVSTLAIAAVLLMLLASFVSASVRQLSANADDYAAQLARLLETLVDMLPREAGQLVRETDVRRLLGSPVQTVAGLLMGTTNAILDLLSKSLLVFLFVCFLLIGSEGHSTPGGVWPEVRVRVQRFLAIKTVVSAATGALVGLVLALLGIDLAMVFGLFAFLLNFVPSLGSVVATLLPLPVVLVSPHVSAGAAVAAIVLPGCIQFLIGNVLEPRIMGERLDLHPVTVLLSLVVWGMLWGIVGMLLATPITAVLKMLLDRFEGARWLSDLMAGRLSPGPAEPA